MVNKKYIYLLFAVMVFAQILVPLQMIYHHENILTTGKIFKFKTQPIDPNDPFRGKYIDLAFEENNITVKNIKNYQKTGIIFVKIKNDTLGFAKIISISKTEPDKNSDYLALKLNYANELNNNTIFLDLPFSRYYMNENKAQSAENLYRESTKNIQNNTYALVAVKSGEGIIKDVMIDEVSIKKLVK